jgi:hypothetical protein
MTAFIFVFQVRYYLNKAFSRERETRPDGTAMNLAQRRVEGDNRCPDFVGGNHSVLQLWKCE